MGALPDADHQAPFGRLRLCDAALPGEKESVGAGRLLARMALADAQRRAETRDIAGALETLDRVLAANPDDCTALTSKAAIYLRGGNAAEALTLGELMELRVPGDYRGPLTVGRALATMGRYREALVALDRAIFENRTRRNRSMRAPVSTSGWVTRSPRRPITRTPSIYDGKALRLFDTGRGDVYTNG